MVVTVVHYRTESGLLFTLLALLLKEKMKFNIQKISITLSQALWTLPFIAFFIGYFSLQFFIIEKIVQAPNLVGKDLLQATKIASSKKLNLRIIAEKEIADTLPGTIIKQNPLPNTSIKSHQSIFITITKSPETVVAPAFITKSHEQIEQTCKDKKIKNRPYFLSSNYPKGECIGQLPLQNKPLESKKMSTYISTGNQNQYLFPDLTSSTLEEASQLLSQHNISFDVYYRDQKINAPYNRNFVVSYQKPLAGTFITLNEKLYVQLKVT